MILPKQLPNRSVLTLLVLLALASITSMLLAGCREDLPPVREVSVRQQSKGRLTVLKTGETTNAVLLVHQSEGSPLGIEIKQEQSPQKTRVTASFPDAMTTHAQLVHQLRGWMQVSMVQSRLTIEQAGGFRTPLYFSQFEEQELTGAIAQASFEFNGTRELEYELGQLVRGLDGEIKVVFSAADGTPVARFEGMTTLPAADKYGDAHGVEYLGTELAGELDGAWTLGGTLFGGSNPAWVKANLVLGGLRIAVGQESQTAAFAPLDRVSLGKVSVRCAPDPECQGPLSFVEVRDQLETHIILANVDLGGSRAGAGSAMLRYELRMAIDPYQISANYSYDAAAHLKSTDEKYSVTLKAAPWRERDGRVVGGPRGSNGLYPRPQMTIDW